MKDEQRNNATVGIFMPAYNQGKFIYEAIESLQKQTFQDFVLHIVDDGSDDRQTSKILSSIKYDKAKIFLNKENKGVAYRAREHYKMLDNKYILVLCADDKIAPTFLEKTVQFLDKNIKYGAVSTDMLQYMDIFEGKPVSTVHFDKSRMGLPEMLSECHCLGSSLMRGKALRELDLSGGFVRYQDWDRWISMLEAGWKIGLIPEPLFMYRLHNDSLSHSSNAGVETEVFGKIIKKHKKLYNKYNVIVMEDLFCKFQESGFFNKNLSRLFLNMEKENVELKKQLQDLQSSKVFKIIRKINKLLGR